MAKHRTPAVTTEPAICYRISNGWAWAQIYVRHGLVLDPGQRQLRTWISISVVSDFDDFGFVWSHASGPWRDFLAGLDMHYAMNKMLGKRFKVELTADEAAQHARAEVLRLRSHRHNGRDPLLDKADARKLWDGIGWAEGDASGAQDFLRRWDDETAGLVSRQELAYGEWTKVAPSAVAFWADIWPHFVTALRCEDAYDWREPTYGEVQRSFPSQLTEPAYTWRAPPPGLLANAFPTVNRANLLAQLAAA